MCKNIKKPYSNGESCIYTAGSKTAREDRPSI